MQALNYFKNVPIQISFNKHLLAEHMRLCTEKETYERKTFCNTTFYQKK